MKKLVISLSLTFCLGIAAVAQPPYTSMMGTFGQPRQFISELSDELYNANARFSVTPSNVGSLFTNEVNSPGWFITAGTAGTITINLTAKGEVPSAGITYPAGYIYVSFYYLGIAATVTGQVQYANGTWAAMGTFTNISTVGGETFFVGSVPGTNWVTAIQLTITATAGAPAEVTKIEYHRTEADDQLPISAVTKYNTNKLYAPLYFQDGNNTNQAYISSSGTAYLSTQLGIGTASPTAQLHTTGTVRLTGLGNDNTQARLIVSDTNGNISWRNASTLTGTGAGWALVGNAAINPSTTFIGTTDNTPIPFRTNNLERMRVDVNGNVLIGRTTQVNTGYILDVNGNARINQITVNTSGADFVFDPGYRLPPLAKVESYIRTNHHLPDIPSAAEMQTKGLDVGAGETVLLRKVEELTLYVIEQGKRQEAQAEEIKRLQRQNEKLLRQLKRQKAAQ